MSIIKKTLNVNGKKHTFQVEGSETLLWVLRDVLKLKGTKYGCGEAACGACAVLMNGKVALSCVTPLASLTRKSKIITIEGLSMDGKLSPLQQAFIDYNAFCCGYCTPGMIITATALLIKNPHPSKDEIIQTMDNNLCRCASYPNIVKAIQAVASGSGENDHDQN